jgi:hypothetical protein
LRLRGCVPFIGLRALDMNDSPVVLLNLNCPIDRRTQLDPCGFHRRIQQAEAGSSNFLRVDDADLENPCGKRKIGTSAAEAALALVRLCRR